MGLSISHGCWDGGYISFMIWRKEIAKAAGLPPLLLMEGFYYSDSSTNPFSLLKYNKDTLMVNSIQRNVLDYLPIKWDCLTPSPLYELLYHSDTDGSIEADKCALLADELEKLLPNLPEGEGGGHIGNWRETTQEFIDGLREAAKAGEDVEFG